MFDAQIVRRQYSRQAGFYDLAMPLWKLWGLSDAWRKRAVGALNLRRGSTVLELGCGTGLNFALLYEAVGPAGRITGVDLTPAMLAEAQKRMERHGWNNIKLIEADMTRFEPPRDLDGILSTYAMSVIPENAPVIRRCVKALPNGGRLVILDVRLTGGGPAFLRPFWMLLTKPFAGSHETSRQDPGEEMRKHLRDVQVTRSRLGFVYLVSGTKVADETGQ